MTTPVATAEPLPPNRGMLLSTAATQRALHATLEAEAATVTDPALRAIYAARLAGLARAHETTVRLAGGAA